MRWHTVSSIRKTILLMAVSALFGCAGGAVPTPPAETTDTVPQQDSVSRLGDGKTGFVINENYQINTNQRDLFKLGVDALESGEYDVAVNCFKAITDSAPEWSSPYVNLAIAYLRSGRNEYAEVPLKKALELVAGHPLASHEYGILLRQTGRFDEARAVYEKSLKFFPEYFPLHRNLGVLCDIYLDDLKCAVNHYQKYLQAQPGDKSVELWLAEVRGR